MKTILVTGASGFLGSNLITRLLERGDSHIIAVLGRPEDKANLLPQNERITIYPCSEFFTTDFGHVDTLIHTAFSRGENLLGLTASIEFSGKVIELVNNQDIDSIINISTQGLYKVLRPGEKVSEDGIIGPNTSYGLAKWAVENMINIGCKKHYTNIRMASLSANARFLDFFVDSVMKGRDITVTAPNQYASIIDVEDAVNGILSIIDMPIQKRGVVYNLGPGEQHSILDYAKAVNQIGKQFSFAPVDITIDDCGKDFAICMDCSKLRSQTCWTPVIGLNQMITFLFKTKANE